MRWLKFSALIFAFVSASISYAGYTPWGDLHWKAPVASSSALPASGNLTGDVRMELTAFGLYYWSGSAWVLITAGSGGSPGGSNTDVQFNSSGSFGGSANLTWNGTVLGVTGSVNASNFTDSALSTGLPILSNAPFSTGTLSGNTTEFGTISGALTSGDGIKVDASGNLVDTGSAAATVTSVGLSMPASGFSVSGSPVTGSGTLSVTYSGTFPNAQIPAAQAGSLGGVESLTCGSHEWMEQLANTGIFTCTQPAFSDLSGSASKTQLPNTIVYSDQANTYSSGPQSLGSQALSDQIPNASITGTTLNKLAKINANGSLVIMATSDTSGAYGVVVAGAGTSGSADVAQVGQASCVFDGATTAGDYVTISSSTAGDCHDDGASAPAGVQAVGRVLTTNASAGTYAMALLSGGGGGSTVPGGSNTDVQYNSSGSFGGDSGMTYDGAGNLTLTGKVNATTALLSNLTASEPVVSDVSKNLASGSVSAPLTFSAGAFGISLVDSITTSGSSLALSGDSAAPGNGYYYGTNGSGVKGWYVLSAAKAPTQQILTSGTTYTTPTTPVPLYIRVSEAGAGGGGGGAGNTSGNAGGGGGGSGETCIFTIGNPTTTYTFAIGTAGLAGTTSTNGGAGGNTSFNGIVANGGGGASFGGGTNSPGVGGAGGGGGCVGVEDIPGTTGSPGSIGIASVVSGFAGNGASSFFGGGGQGATANAGAVGAAGKNGGGGGGGTYNNNGGAGGPGTIVVDEYYQ